VPEDTWSIGGKEGGGRAGGRRRRRRKERGSILCLCTRLYAAVENEPLALLQELSRRPLTRIGSPGFVL
jgi:hypothetical protein